MNCSHPACHCQIASGTPLVEREGKKYCSKACAVSAERSSGTAGGCNCGHADCAPGKSAIGDLHRD
jgi:hypothetical protein